MALTDVIMKSIKKNFFLFNFFSKLELFF